MVTPGDRQPRATQRFGIDTGVMASRLTFGLLGEPGLKPVVEVALPKHSRGADHGHRVIVLGRAETVEGVGQQRAVMAHVEQYERRIELTEEATQVMQVISPSSAWTRVSGKSVQLFNELAESDHGDLHRELAERSGGGATALCSLKAEQPPRWLEWRPNTRAIRRCGCCR